MTADLQGIAVTSLGTVVTSIYTVGNITNATSAAYLTDGSADEVQINQAIADANAAGGGTVFLLSGTYTIAAPIILLSNVALEGLDAGVSRIVACAGYSNSYRWMVVAQGSATSDVAIPLAANAEFADQFLTFTESNETAAIAANDHIFVRADRNADPIVTTNRYVGEFVKILSVVGNMAYIWNTLRDAYAMSDNAKAYRITFVQNCGVRKLEFFQTDAYGTRTGNAAVISFILTKNSFIDRCLIHDNDGPGVTLSQTIDTKVTHNTIRDLTNVSPALGYGVLIGGASEGFVVEGNFFENVRHAVDGGPHGGDPAAVNTYGIPRSGIIIGNTANRVLAASYTTHSDAEGWLWSGNTASNGIGHGMYLRGRGMMIQGNSIVQCTAGIEVGDTSFYGSGGSAAGTIVVGNTIRYCKKLMTTTQYTNAKVGQSNATGDGIILGLTDNVTVTNNIIEYTDGAGIALRRGACRNIIKGNTILNPNLLNVAATAAGSSAITLDNAYRSTSASISMSGSTVTITTKSTIDDIIVGKTVHVHDCINSGNNGLFIVLSKPTISTFTYTNASGVNELGTVQYVVEACTDNIVESNVARNTTSSYDPNSTGHSKYLICDFGVTATAPSSSVHQGNVRNVFKENIGIDMETDILSVIDVSFIAGNSPCESMPVAAKAGIPVDANFLSKPQSGTLAQNITTGKLFIRSTTYWEPVGGYNVALISNFTTKSTSSTNTNLSFPVKSGETWQFEFELTAECNNTGGTKFQISGPSTSAILCWLETFARQCA